jgi:4-amino-4-deoxy-L-arabinose transferase-like glycosyltransferase
VLDLEPLKSRVKSVNKWQLAFIAFLIGYFVLLSINLDRSAIQWDEITHLNGGSFLLRGEFQTYISLSAFYPPMFDLVTMVFFKVLGISVFSARLVAVVFSVLTLGLVFEFARRLYNVKTAFVAGVLLAVMPGYIWLSRMAMIETMLVFFFTLAVFSFYLWLKNKRNIFLVLAGLALGLGFLTKYQMIIAAVIMIASLLLFARDRLKLHLSKFTILLAAGILVVIPWLIINYSTYASNMLSEWFYAVQVGNPDKSLYSVRFDAQFGFPVSYTIFYFIEMVWPYSNVHPISLLLYGLSLAGLGFLVWRRKLEDKYLLVWFVVVFVFFTLIPNKQWRYVLPLFPVLAIAAARLVSSVFDYAKKIPGDHMAPFTEMACAGGILLTHTLFKSLRLFAKKRFGLTKKRAIELSAILLAVFLTVGLYLSVSDAYYWETKDDIQVQVGQATSYASTLLGSNDSIMIVCPFNLFSQDMVRFFLWANPSYRNNAVNQYPELPVDTFTPNFNVTEFVSLCRQNHVKAVMFYEYGSYVPYFNTTLTLVDVFNSVEATGNFTQATSDHMFGTNPRRVIVIEFLG